MDIREALSGPSPSPGGGLLQQLGLASLGSRVETRLASLGIRLPGPRGGGQDDPLAPFMGEDLGSALWGDASTLSFLSLAAQPPLAEDCML